MKSITRTVLAGLAALAVLGAQASTLPAAADVQSQRAEVTVKVNAATKPGAEQAKATQFQARAFNTPQRQVIELPAQLA